MFKFKKWNDSLQEWLEEPVVNVNELKYSHFKTMNDGFLFIFKDDIERYFSVKFSGIDRETIDKVIAEWNKKN